MGYRTWGLMAILLLAGCQPDQLLDSRKTGQGLTPGSDLISNNGASLSGTLRIPDPTLISNNSSKLVNEGGAAFYRILQLADNPLFGAEVSLVDAWGKAVSSEKVKTDQSGRFAFASAPSLDQPYFVQASFTVQDLPFVFRSMITQPEASADIDVASTLLAEKGRELLQRGAISQRWDSTQLRRLVSHLRASLTPAQIPYMAAASEDVLSTFDQLVQDDGTIRDLAAALGAAVAKPARGWEVETLYSDEELAAKGVIPAEIGALTKYGPFEVDVQGNMYFPRPTEQGDAIRIMKLGSAGEVSDFAQLPVGISAPVVMGFSPAGKFFAIGSDLAAKRVRVFSGTGSMVAEPGFLGVLPPQGVEFAPGRIAVDADENVYLAVPTHHVVLRLDKGADEPRIVAGKTSEAGWVDARGAAARFNYPVSLALAKNGDLFVADRDNACVRRLTPEGEVTTYAGKPGEPLYRNGRGAYARFGSPQAVALDERGTVFVTDVYNNRVRRISPFGSVYLVVGSGQEGLQDGVGAEASLNQPRFLKFDGARNLYLRDRDVSAGKEWIRRIRPTGN